MNDRQPLVEEWLAKASEDALSIRAILKEGAPSTACFLSQQMAEKLLKALLTARTIRFPKTHDLVALAALAHPAVPDIEIIRPELEELNHYAVEIRYPGDYPHVTHPEATTAFAAAERVQEFILQKTSPEK